MANRVKFFGGCEFDRTVRSSLVRAITEWLIFGESTCTVPIILAACRLPIRFYIVSWLLLGAAFDDVGVSHALFFFFSGGVLVIDLY